MFYQFGERSICCSIKSLHFSVVFIKPVFNESGYRYFLKSILATVSEPRFLSARSVYQRSVYQRSVYQRSVYQRFVYQRFVYQRSVYQRFVYQRSVYQRFVSALFMGKNCDANRCSPASKR